MTLMEWLRVAEFLVVLLTSVVVIARWSQKVETPAPALIVPAVNGLDHRVRDLEQRLVVIAELTKHQERRLDEIHGKLSDIGDMAQAFVGQATERFVSIRECDRRHQHQG